MISFIENIHELRNVCAHEFITPEYFGDDDFDFEFDFEEQE